MLDLRVGGHGRLQVSLKRAVYYYDKTRDHKSRMLAFYYNGIVLLNAHRYTESAIYFEKAIIEASILSDYLYLGLSNRSLAEIMNQTLNFPNAILYEEKAIDNFHKGGEYLYESYGWLSLAIAYSNNKQYDKAISLSDSLYTLMGSKILQDSFEQVKAESLIESEECDPTIPVDIYRRADKRYFYSSDYGYYAYALDMIGQRDSADLFLQKAFDLCTNRIDSAGIKVFQARINNNRGNYKTAYQLLNSSTNIQDSLIRDILRQSVSVAQKDFFNKEAQYQELKAYNARLSSLVISLALGALFLFGLFIAVLENKKKQEQMKEQLLQLALEREKANRLYSDKAHLLGSLFSERLGHIDRLAKDYMYAETPEEKDIIFKDYKKKCSTMLKDRQVFDSLESDLNKYCDGIMDKLRTEVPSIKGNNLNTISLFFAGVPTLSIQIITGKPSIKSVEMVRSRYRNVIRESSAEHTELFLKMLETRKRHPEK
ncbi:MAG: hypothetical protein J5669_02000 [Bacteroidales bacterium]|nr:hypothetical protein [Bacteroidales bacterium]